MPKREIEKWFEKHSPWCPLFGVIPFKFLLHGNARMVTDPIMTRCLRIIEEARETWNVRHPLDMPPFPYSWPEPKEVSWYPTGELLAARGLFWHVLDIMSASQVFNPDTDPDQIRDSEILWHARDYGRSFEGAEEVDDYKMFAILAIYLSWHVLKKILLKESNAEDPEIFRDLLYAEAFLSKRLQMKEMKQRMGNVKGGSASKQKKGIIQAIQWARKKSKNQSASGLWKFLSLNCTKDKPFKSEDGYSVYFYVDPNDNTKNRLCQEIEGRETSIGREAFNKIVHKNNW
jgi:hypothetical protein